MLLCLRVRDFAIIDELEVAFDPGFNVVTGETGAGKSILVNALQLVLGGRPKAEVVRGGAENAQVEALFDVGDDPEVRKRMEASGIVPDNQLVIRRVIAKAGRARAFANGQLASSAQIEQLASGLADISSQHEHHTLVDPRSHLNFLDAFADATKLRSEVALVYEMLLKIRDALEHTRRKCQDRTAREDLLRYQIAEIDELDPKAGELVELIEERERQRHAEQLASLTANAEHDLYARDNAICEELARVADSVRQAANLDQRLNGLADQLASLHLSLEECARELGGYARRVSADPEKLGRLEQRIDLFHRLQRKYGGSVESMLEHRERAQTELEQLFNSEDQIVALEKEFKANMDHAEQITKKLSAHRVKAAEKLARAISQELGSLGMGDARVIVEVEPAPEKEGELSVAGARLSPNGIDRVEFLIAPNRGEQPQALQKIASGGELSRAMLAVKRVLAGLGPAGLYVFDEVDAGIGGAVAETIGRKLREVSRHHQVICITHLPQIAVFADAHFQVSKKVEKGRTISEITPLGQEQKAEEIARMLGGVKITRKTREAAAEMLDAAHK
ncbi:MAG: DNA repair protein RecN [Deltaproteobacteria bacterium]|nr:DNA repair protein RecN [Deltaproteobacteria bacterium]